jgi:alpha-glucoside transport system permease protein
MTATTIALPREATSNHRARVGLRRSTRTGFALRLITAGLIVVWLIPSLGLLITSFRPAADTQQTGWWTVLREPSFTLDNYRDVLDASGLARAIVNSLLIAIPSTVFPLTIALFAGYAFSWIRFPYRETIFTVVIALMVVPVQMSLVPLLSAFSHGTTIGSVTVAPAITNPLVRLWLVNTAYGLPLAVYLMRNYISSLPAEIISAARVDGASSFAIFWRIVLPLTKPALASFAIFQFLFVYNDYLVALTFVGLNTDSAPVTVILADLVGSRGENAHLLTAGAWIAILIPLTVFFAFQRHFVAGLTAGAVKT